MAKIQDRSEMTGCTDPRKEVCSDICEELLPFPNELLCIHFPSSSNPVHVEVGSDSHVIVTLLARSTLG